MRIEYVECYDYYYYEHFENREPETIRWDDCYPVFATVKTRLRRTFWQALLGWLTFKPYRFATIEYEIGDTE